MLCLLLMGLLAYAETSPVNDIREFCHSRRDGLYAHPTDCAHFIQCSKGRTFQKHCAPGTAWRQDIMTCDHVSNVPGCDHGA